MLGSYRSAKRRRLPLTEQSQLPATYAEDTAVTQPSAQSMLTALHVCLAAVQTQTDSFEQWVSESELGTVLLKDHPAPYGGLETNYQSFSNTHPGGVRMLPSCTHVAVGFADLGELAAAVSAWGTAKASSATAAPAPPTESGRKKAGSRHKQLQQQYRLGDSDEDFVSGSEYAL